MNIPREPQADTPIPADWGRDVVRCLRSLRSKPGPGITLNRTPEGTTISSKGSEPVQAQAQAAGSGVVVAKISGGTALDGFSVECYPNYPELTGQYSGTLVVMELALGGDLPVDTLVLAHKMAVTLTGGE